MTQTTQQHLKALRSAPNAEYLETRRLRCSDRIDRIVTLTPAQWWTFDCHSAAPCPITYLAGVTNFAYQKAEAGQGDIENLFLQKIKSDIDYALGKDDLQVIETSFIPNK